MNQFRRFMALLLAVVLVIGLFPVRASAEEQEPLTFETTYINPIYADIVSEEDIPPVVTPKVQTYETVHYVTTMEDAGLVLREQMKARMEAPVVHIFANVSTSEEFSALCRDLYEVAITHTREPDEGDYILWHLSGYKASGKRYTAEGGYNIDITYSMVYHSNAEQEAAVDNAVKELLSQLNLSGRSDYEKVKAVYDYICTNVTYDHSDTEDTLKHTAYAALIKKTAVCQGYASLLYRLLLELGVDTRVIAGSTSGGDHGWNIVELDSLYYNADSTWDEGNTSYSWFLKSPANFPDHNRFAEYTTAAFTGAYPMASADYVPHPHSYSTAVTAPTCTEQGYTTYTCSCGDTYVGDYVDATGHSFGSWYQTKAPTEDEVGEERRDCANCDHCETRVVAKLEPSNPSGTCGENLTWVLDEKGTLTIKGSGAMDAVGFDSVTGQYLPPWSDWQDRIKSVVIESGVTDIVDQAFGSCKNLETIVIPATVTKLGDYAILCCPSLKDIQVDNGNQHYCTVDGVLYSKDMTTLIKYPACRPGTEYTVPDTVTKLMHVAFDSASKLVNITLPDNITVLDTDTFADCTSLKNIQLPKNLTNMEAGGIFWNCSSLESIELPDNVQVIGSSAFAYCSNLKQVTLPAGLKKIDGHAFGRCENLATITIPAGVNYLEFKIFEASGLQSIIFEGDAPNFHEETFTNISATAYYPANNTTWTSAVMQDYGGDITWVAYGDEPATSGTCGENLTWVFDEETGTLTISGTGEMENIYWPYEMNVDNPPEVIFAPWHDFADQILHVETTEGVASISHFAFFDCVNMKTITIAESVTNVGCAFVNSGVTELYIPAAVNKFTYPSNEGVCETLQKITVAENNAVYSSDEYGMLYNKDKTEFIGCPTAYQGSYVIANSVSIIGDWAFNSCTGLTNIYIPGSVSTIGSWAFWDCSGLTEVTLCDGITVIEDNAFGECTALSTLSFPSTISIIDDYAFQYCSGVNSIRFACDAPHIGLASFHNVTATAYYPANNSTWTSDVMKNYGGNITWVAYGDDPATSGTCGDNLTWNFNETSGQLTVSGSGTMYGADKLGWTAFAGDIRSVEIGNGATSVGAYAFADCTKLEDVQMPNSVLSIAYNAFENCSSLTAVDIPGNVTEIAYGAFMDCSSLTAVAIPDNVMEISYSAFKDCTSLASLELPQNVMTISYHAFDNCTSLSEVDFPASLASIGDEAFGSCTGLDEMHFTGNAPAIQSNAFSSVTADAYYPAANTTWTPNVLQNYGGSLTWIAEGGTVTPDNSCGENITWKFEASTGTLTISGTEPMARSNGSSVMDDYARPEDTPWFEYQDQIITVIIESTVDSIGKNAFAGCSNLTTVIIEEGVSEIDSTAFSDCESLENCYFEGTEDQWDDLGADIGESTLHTESAKPEAHTETKKTVAPTCTEKGYDLYTCSCGTTRKDNFTDPAGHKWNDGVVTKEPTETETGIRLHTCTVCQETEERTIPVKDHTHKYAKTVTAPTCVADGYTTYICTCGDTFVSDTVPAQGHSWNDGEITREPSAQAPGIRTFTCTVCKTTRTEEIPYEAPVVSNSVYRISGKDRVKTALSVAKALKDTLKVDKFDAVIIATGVNEKFADALAGSYLANRKKAPILLYTNSGLSQLNVNFIKENLKTNGTVYILGGDSAVPTTVEQTLSAYNVVRLSGKTRYETNLKILEEAGISGADEILVATGTNFADCLSASAVGLPLLLVNGKNTAPNAVQTEFLKSVAGKKITIIGGDGAVSEEMKAAIEKITGVTAERISGKTRHNTSVLIAQKYFADADFALITYAKNFPDGLAGGPLAYAMDAPLLLTNAGQEGIAGEYIVAEDIENGYVLGGDSAVSDETARKVFGLAADAAIEKAYYTG